MSKMNEDYALWKSRLAIHIHDLHNDCATQASYYAEVAETAAALHADMHSAKAKLDLVKAEVGSDIRANPGKHNLDKVTEGGIATAVALDKSVRDAEDEYARISREHGLVDAFVTAFEHRRSMINNEVTLYSNNYWGDVQATSPGTPDARATLRSERMSAIVGKRANRRAPDDTDGKQEVLEG